MPKKKIDSRVRTLIENGIKQRHRTMFVLVGDKGREQVRRISAEAGEKEAVYAFWSQQRL